MKIKRLNLLMILSFVFFISCNSNDESSQTDPLNGIWNLKNISGGLQGISIHYNQGDVFWNFNLNNNTLIVENNIITTGPESIHAGLDSGIYNIRFEQNGDIKTLFINNIERGVIVLSNTNNLKIDDGFIVDGLITEFDR